MLYESFNSINESFGIDFFTSRLDDEAVRNLNPKFELREYQKEALGRFDFYFKEYQKRKWPAHLLFHMATGSGKTLIMAANILQLYLLGYRNFIFFVNSTNVVEKTKDNFLNHLSEKYLFAPKIKFGEKQVFIKEVENFEAASRDDINIHFTTIQGLHSRINHPRENSVTYEDFADEKVVLISDEAHHLQTLTKSSRKEVELEKSWEYTVERIFQSNTENILLEFTATIDLSNENIYKKYEDKIIFQYDLKQFRLDKYSKEIEVLQADLEPIDRAIQAIILSQYRRKIAEKNKVSLKPVLLFKSKSIKESKENYEAFLTKIKQLKPSDLQEIFEHSDGTVLEKAFKYFEEQEISFENLIIELQEDFNEEKCMLLDSENIDEEKQLKLNSLENKNNEIRAIFTVNMLNEGWDVLNLFDIVRLYDTRDGRWVHGKYKPGNTTMGEAQLIGRGARYFPFQIESQEDKYRRKFDADIENELRILETLHYHSAHNPKYIDEIRSGLTELGLLPEKYVQVELFVKDSFKESDLWKNGVIFINERTENTREDIFSLKDAKIELSHFYQLKTGENIESVIFEDEGTNNRKNIPIIKVKYKLNDFGENVVRFALDKTDFFSFEKLKNKFPHVHSISEFISSYNYLGGVEVEVSGPIDKINQLSQSEKLQISISVLRDIASIANSSVSEYKGTKRFKAKLIQQVFHDKKMSIGIDEFQIKEFHQEYLYEKDWYAQNQFYGTDEEQKFLLFFDSFIDKLQQKYTDIALFRNEKYFQIFDFDEGRAFEPDFVLVLKNKNKVISFYQVFIEPKGDQFKDKNGKFVDSKEGWKQEFLIKIENEAETDLKLENEKFILLGLPFYNERLKKDFEKAFTEKLLPR